MVSSRGNGLQYSIARIIFPPLLLIQLSCLPAYPLSLAGEIISHIYLIDTRDGILSRISFPYINAKTEVASQIPQPVIDKVQLYNLEKSVHDLSSFHTRHSESESIDDVAYWLAEKLQSNCSTDVYIQNFTYSPSNTTSEDDDDFNNIHRQKPLYNLKNISCDKLGSTNHTILVSAHYDSRAEDLNDSDSRAPGADDNASGVSVLLEVARILSNVSLDHSISFALFSGEEQGKWGSKYYAEFIDKADIDLDLLINLDMVGFPPEGPSSVLVEYDNGNVVQDNDKYSQKIAKFIKDVASKYTDLNATLGILGNADYLPFEALGYTVIGFHDDGVTKNPNYHKSSDTFDTLDYKYIASVANLTIATILQLDKLVSSDSADVASYLVHDDDNI
ncbi:MAG: M20/M25/M40 family metallo-hydrolase [Nitrososphaeraceae archaeon]